LEDIVPPLSEMPSPLAAAAPKAKASMARNTNPGEGTEVEDSGFIIFDPEAGTANALYHCV
jgi:hypothetical protein